MDPANPVDASQQPDSQSGGQYEVVSPQQHAADGGASASSQTAQGSQYEIVPPAGKQPDWRDKIISKLTAPQQVAPATDTRTAKDLGLPESTPQRVVDVLKKMDLTRGESPWSYAARRFGGGVAQVALHPVDTAVSTAKQTYDILNAASPAAAIVAHVNPNSPQAASINRLKEQGGQLVSSVAQDPVGALADMAGQTAATYGATKGLGEVAGAGARTAASAASKVGDVAQGAAEGISGTSKQVYKAASGAASDIANTAEDTANADTVARQQRMQKIIDTAHANADTIAKYKDKLNQAQADVAAKHTENTAKVTQANQDAQTAHEAELGQTQDFNTGLQQQLDMRNGLQSEIQRATAQVADKEAAARESAWTANSAKWNAVRDKIGDGPVDTSQIVKKINDASKYMTPETQRQFREILNAGPPPEDLDAVRQSIMEKQGLGSDYDALGYNDKKFVDNHTDIHMAQVTPDDMDQIPFSKLQGWYTELGQKLYGVNGADAGNIKKGIREVMTTVKQTADKVAKEHDAYDDLQDARQSHAEFKEAFGRNFTPAATVSDLRMQETNPDYVKQLQSQKRLNAVAAIDPSVAEGHQYIRQLQSSLDKIPEEDVLRKQIKPLPTPPEPKPLPEPPEPSYPEPPSLKPYPGIAGAREAVPTPNIDVQAIKANAATEMLQNWKTLDRYAMTKILSGLIGGPLISIMSENHGLGFAAKALGVSYGVARLMLPAVAAMMDRPAVIQWLSKPSVSDIQTLSRIPYADRIAIQTGFTEAAEQAAREGRPVKIDPMAAQWLGRQNTAKIAKAVAGAAATAKSTTAPAQPATPEAQPSYEVVQP